MSVENILLHLCTPVEWRSFLQVGAVAPPSLDEVGFVHLSTPEQVALPAQRLFAGRTDLVLLVVDPDAVAKAGVEVRWEPGVPGDPESMRFPHAYGAVPAAAVLAVLPYRPGPDGFTAPEVPVPDASFRAAHWEPSLVRRAADAEEPVTGGVAVRTSAYPASRMHNLLLIDRPHLTGADTVAAEADRALTAHGLHPVAQLSGLGADELAVALATAGWRIQQFDDLTAPAGPVAGGIADRVSEVELDVVRPVRAASWAATLPGATPEEIAQLVDREAGDARVVAIHHLAVLDGAAVVGTATLKRDGATAWIDGMETAPAHRGRGHGRALLARARELAAEHGCDLVALGADVADWPRDWYLRAGFTAAGTRFEATGPG